MTPQSVLLPGVTFFIFQLPRSACAYHGLAVSAWQVKHWGGYSNASYGTCVPNQTVNLTVGRGTWGPGVPGPALVTLVMFVLVAATTTNFRRGCGNHDIPAR